VMAELLGIDAEQMRFWLCNRKIVTANESVTKPLTATQVCEIHKLSTNNTRLDSLVAIILM